jgi:hypothetical protein
VTSGYTLGFRDSTASFLNVGGGFTYWFRDKTRRALGSTPPHTPGLHRHAGATGGFLVSLKDAAKSRIEVRYAARRT